MNKMKWMLSVALIVCVSVVAAACGGKNEATPASTGGAAVSGKASKLDQIKKAGKIVLGTSADYPPYEFHKSINGKDEIVGFDIEIAKEFAKDLGVKLEIKDMKFEGLLPALQAGTIDFVLAGMTPKEERKQAVDFTQIYYTAKQTVVIRAEDKEKFKTIADLKGKKVGAQKGSVQEDILKDQLKDAEAKILSKVPDLFLELKTKKVDALIMEHPVTEAYVSRNKDLAQAVIQLKQDDGGSAIAFQKGQKELVDAANKTLDRLLKDKKIDKFVAEASDMVE